MRIPNPINADPLVLLNHFILAGAARNTMALGLLTATPKAWINILNEDISGGAPLLSKGSTNFDF